MTTPIQRQLALIPLAQLNATLVAQGVQPQVDKNVAVEQVDILINTGKTTLDQVRQARGNVNVNSVALNSSIPDDIRKKIINATADVARQAQDLERIRSVVDASLNEQLRQNSNIVSSFDALSKRLNAKVEGLQGVDYNIVKGNIQAEVAKLFDEFRTVTPREQIVELAKHIPSTVRKTALDVFGDICHYESGGETIDFSSFEVDVWNDPDAPALVADYNFNPEHLHQALIALDDPLPDNVWLAGERGTGKTEFVAQLANRLGRRLFRVNFDEALERAEFIGGNTIENSNVVWKAGVITQAIQHAGAIVLLDEIGFARAQNLAVLHALCERSPHRSIVISETGTRIPVASHVVFFGADNSNGHGDASGNFAGVRDQNTAFLDRFSFTLRFDYLPHDDEVALIHKRTGLALDATEVLVKFANVAREKARAGLLTQPPSLRQLFAWARAITKGIPVRIAFENAIVNKFPQDCESELRGVFSATIDVDNLKSFLRKV